MTKDTERRGGRAVTRRRFVAAAGASGVAAALAGCTNSSGHGAESTTTATPGGTTSGSGGGTTLQWAAGSAAKEHEDAINQALHDGGLSKDVTVDVLPAATQTDSREQKYTQWLSSNRNQPDLLVMDSGWTIPFIVRDQLANLSETLDSETLKTVQSDYFDASVKTASAPSSNDLYGVPLFPDFSVMLYRKDLLKQAGHAPKDSWATDATKWSEFTTAVADAKKRDGTQFGYTWQGHIYEGLACCDFNELMSSCGGAYFGGTDNLFGPIGERPITVDEQPVIDAIKLARSLINGPDAKHTLDGIAQVSPKAVLDYTENPSLKPFQNGNAVANRNWPYAIKRVADADAVGHENLGVMPIPYHVAQGAGKYSNLGGPTSALGGANVALNPNSKKTDAAVEVLQTLTSDDFQIEFAKAMGYLVPKPKLFDSSEMKALPGLGPYVETLKAAGNNAIPRPVTAVWPQESSKIAQKVHAGIGGDKTPTEAMAELQQSLQAIENSV